MCGARLLDVYLSALDGGDCSLPTRERFFEGEFDGVVDVVTFAGEEWVFFLQ